MTVYNVGLRVPLDEVLEGDTVLDTALGEDAHVEITRPMSIEQALEYAANGTLTLPNGVLRIDNNKILRQCSTGQVHVELNKRWLVGT